jgi:methylated-DNA-[protein]-cysteine S-methyltransferase
LTLTERDGHIAALHWGDDRCDDETELLCRARRQLDAYFNGALRKFDLPLAPDGSDYQRRVWRKLADIPYGETLSYGALAKTMSTGARAVGTACASNPLPIILPCHRVVGGDGALTGYSGGDGLATKRYFLRMESASAA